MARKPRNLFAGHTHSSFLEGMAHILDIGGTLSWIERPSVEELRERHAEHAERVRRIVERSGPEADAEALREIWAEVGQYLYDAIGQFEEENGLPSGGWRQ